MRTVFFSLDTKKERASQFSIRAARARLTKLNVKHQLVIGCYRGKPETTIKALVDNEAQLDEIRAIASFAGQESILIVDSDLNAMLEYMSTGLRESMGIFISVDKDFANNSEAWTYVPHENKYYACL